MLISPRMTLRNCGISSSEVLRRIRPTRVIRGSSVILKKPTVSLRASSDALRCSASGTIVRNLSMQKRLPSRPTRNWRKKTGPGESSRTATATAASTGARATKASDGDQHVKRSLDGAGARREPEAAQAEHRHAVDVLEVDRGADDLEHPREQADADADRLRDADQLQRLAVVGRGRREDHAVDVVLEHEREQAEVPVERVRASGRGPSGSVATTSARARLAWTLRRTWVASSASPITRQRSGRPRAAGRSPAPRTSEHERQAQDQPQDDEHVGLECLAADHGGGDRRHAGELQQDRGLVERRAAQHEVVAVVEVAGLERQHGGQRHEQVDGREREADGEPADQQRHGGGDGVGGDERATVAALAGDDARQRMALGDRGGAP